MNGNTPSTTEVSVRTMALTVRLDHDLGAWDWAVMGQDVPEAGVARWFASGRVPGRNREDALVCAISAVHARLTARGPVRLALAIIDSAPFWAIADDVAAVYPGLEIVPAGHEFGNLVRDAVTALDRVLAGPSLATAAPAHLTVATDGSATSSILGWGWLAQNGQHGATGRTVPTSLARGRVRPLVAEVLAIAAAVRALPHSQLTVLTDSRHAISLIQDWFAGMDRTPSSVLDSARELLMAQAHRIELAWVPGHTGHALNEGADCLAKMGRRRLEARWGDVYCDLPARAREVAAAFAPQQDAFARTA